jgi:hypothetical protein
MNPSKVNLEVISTSLQSVGNEIDLVFNSLLLEGNSGHP